MRRIRQARDHELLDGVDAFPRLPFTGTVWRAAREGRDPTLGSPSLSRWCDGSFDVLYTAQEADGAVAEVHAFLALQPVFPSKIAWHLHALTVEASQTLHLADLPTLARLGVDTARYGERNYEKTQQIADAAHFLGFDGLLAPSARWPTNVVVLFTHRIDPDRITCTDTTPIDWRDWKRRTGKS